MQSLVWSIVASGVLAAPAPRDSLTVPASRGPVLPAVWSFSEPSLLPSALAPMQRPKAVEFSNAYYTRLAIHRYASFAIWPLFVTEYALGRSLYNQTAPPDTVRGSRSLRTWHGLAADGVYGVFGVNTLTGAWNLWEGRKVKEGRTRRYIHSALMFASDAGFVATAMLAPGRRDIAGTGNPSHRTAHRTVAIVSMSTAVIGDVMMLIWNKK
jgi:hypothetical protein